MNSQGKRLRRLLYVAMRYDYGRPEQGTSFEFTNFYMALQRLVPDVVEFDFMTVMQRQGGESMNSMLLEMARKENPDMIFFMLFKDEIAKETLALLKNDFVTINWFCDDHWRFSHFSRHYAPFFTYVSTTDRQAIPKYNRIGCHNAILTQWGCNHFDYVRNPSAVKEYDVTFIGQPHGNRRRLIEFLRAHGIRVEPFGRGWPNGRVSQEEMIHIINASKINLNLSNSSWNIRTILRGQQQIKGRNFEVPGCGGFLLTNYVGGLEEFYDVQREVSCFRDRRELVQKIGYYLTHEAEREEIARAGYQRTMREHTYEMRFRKLFGYAGFTL